ncbi:transglycosylase domain-containing protein, partial [Salmonella enterica]
RYPVTIEEVSPRYLEALINYEDRWFWRHPGVNPFSVARAAWQESYRRARYPVTIEEVSPRYLEALINYEDRWFWRHPGVNP